MDLLRWELPDGQVLWSGPEFSDLINKHGWQITSSR
jgi:hypothetical protein